MNIRNQNGAAAMAGAAQQTPGVDAKGATQAIKE